MWPFGVLNPVALPRLFLKFRRLESRVSRVVFPRAAPRLRKMPGRGLE